MTTTFVVRVQSGVDGVCGVVERPGRDQRPFRDVAELLELLGIAQGRVGNGAGSSPSSDIREA